jgi:competence protein ComEC
MVPLLLGLFQQVSIVSPIANAFAIPWVSFLVVPLDFLCVVFPFDFLWTFTHWLMEICMWILNWLSEFPAAVWQQHAPPAWAVVIGLLGILWLLLPRGFPARWLGIILIAPMFFIFPAVPAAGKFWLTMLDVGQGLAVVVQTQNHHLLYDAGPTFTEEANSGNRIIVPFLRASGISHLDGVIITHEDDDHYGGAGSVMQAVPVDWLASSLPDDHPLQQMIKNNMKCYAGQKWQWDGVDFEILHPRIQSYQDTGLKDNERGCVLKISSANGSVLLTADIEKKSEAILLNSVAEKLNSTMMLVPHHGSKTSSTPDFIERVAPKEAIISVGYRNRFHHPHPEIISRYSDRGINVFRSDYEGALLIKFENNTGPEINGYRKIYHRYWTTLPGKVESNVNF